MLAESKRVGDLVTALFPLDPDGNVQPLGQSVYSLVCDEVARERMRFVGVVEGIRESVEKALKKGESIAHAAAIGGNRQVHEQAKAMVAQATSLGLALTGVMNIIALPPGTCISCGGTKLSRSLLNPNHMVPCEACKPAKGGAPVLA